MSEGEIFLGYTTGQKPSLLSLNRHALTVAGSGAGKGTCQIIPNLRGPHAWQGSAVVADPKGEAARETAQWRRDELGQEVVVFDPFNYAAVPPELRKTFNPLDLVDSFEAILSLGNGLVHRSENEKEPHWNDGAQTVLEGAIALVKSSPNIPPAHKNLITVVNFLRDLKDKTPVAKRLDVTPGGNVVELWPGAAKAPQSGTVADHAKAALMACDAYGGLSQEAVAFLAETGESSSFFTNLSRQTKWLRAPRMQAFLGGSSPVDLRQLKRGRMTVYLVLPPNFLKLYARFLRVFTSLCLDLMWEKMPDGSELGTRCLFLLDEFPALGKMDSLKVEGLPLGRSYGLHAWPFLQYWQQLVDVYGESGAEAFMASCDAFAAFGLDDEKTPRLLSDLIGRVAVDDLPPLPVPGRRARLRRSSLPSPYMAAGLSDDQSTQAYDRAQIEQRRHEHQERERQAQEMHRATLGHVEAQANAARSLIMARSGNPRVPPDEITRRLSYDPALKHAKAMLVRLTGNSWLWLKPHPYYRPEPAPPPPVIVGKGAFVAALGLALFPASAGYAWGGSETALMWGGIAYAAGLMLCIWENVRAARKDSGKEIVAAVR